MFNEIKTSEDIRTFLEKTNSLHDGHIVDVRYTHQGISKIEGGHYFEPDKTKLVLRILVTSIWDAVVEIEFESLWEWQIKDKPLGLTDTSVAFDEHHRVVWSDDVSVNPKEAKKGSYVVASSMKWRIKE